MQFIVFIHKRYDFMLFDEHARELHFSIGTNVHCIGAYIT